MAAQVALKRQQAAEDRMNSTYSTSLGFPPLEQQLDEDLNTKSNDLKTVTSVLNSSDDIGIQSNSSPKSRSSVNNNTVDVKRQLGIVKQLFPEQEVSVINIVYSTYGQGFEDTIEHFLKQKKKNDEENDKESSSTKNAVICQNQQIQPSLLPTQPLLTPNVLQPNKIVTPNIIDPATTSQTSTATPSLQDLYLQQLLLQTLVNGQKFNAP